MAAPGSLPNPPEPMTELTRLFQQRHVLAHQEGIVGQADITKSGDRAYLVGHRLVTREDAVLLLAGLIEALVTGLRADL